MKTRRWVEVVGLFMGCVPAEQSTSGDATTNPGATAGGTTADSGTPTTGTPTTGTPTTGTPTTDTPTTVPGATDSSGAPVTSEGSETTGSETGSGLSETGTTTDTTTGDESTTGADEVVPCAETWDQPTACTSAACKSVTRAWTLCDKPFSDLEAVDYRFAADGAVLTYLRTDDEHTQVLRVAPDGQIKVLFSEKLEHPQVALNRRAVDFSVYDGGEGNSTVRVFSDQGVLLNSHVESFCGQTFLVPDSTWTVQREGIYNANLEYCQYTSVSVIDGQGALKGNWVPGEWDQDYRVSAAGIYHSTGQDAVMGRTLDGKTKWIVQGIYSYAFEPADLVDRQIASWTEGGAVHMIDGVLVGPVDIGGYSMRIAPSGEYSVMPAKHTIDHQLIHRFVDGELVQSFEVEFASIATLDVSDLGEVAAWGRASDKSEWVALYDVDGAQMWKARVQTYTDYRGVVFSHTGDEIVIRETDALSMFQIDR